MNQGPANERVRDEIQRLNISSTVENRICLYQALLHGDLMIAVYPPDGSENFELDYSLDIEQPIDVRTTEGPNGEPAALAFTDLEMLHSRCGNIAFICKESKELLEWMLRVGFDGVVLNPSGPWAYVPPHHIQLLLSAIEDPSLWYLLEAQLYFEENDYIESEKYLEKLLETTEKRELALLRIAGFYSLNGKLNKAAEKFEEIIEELPESYDARMQLGVTWYTLKQFDKAITVFSETLDLYPHDPDPRFNLGLCYSACEEFEKAIDELEQVVRVRPYDPVSLVNLGTALHAVDRTDDAIEVFNRALAIDPNYPLAMVNLGLCLTERGDSDEAFKLYELAIELDPQFALAHYNMACVHTANLEVEEALRELEAAFTLDPNCRELALCDDSLDSLREIPSFKGLMQQYILQ